MSGTCTYTGSKCSIPDTALGSDKEITAEVEIIRNSRKTIDMRKFEI